jgi:2'-5' RNA ligase
VFPPPDVRRELHFLTPKSHVTLAFLGAAEPAGVSSALAGRSLGPPFRIRLAGSGRFGPVVWAGIDGDLGALHGLRARLLTVLAGFPVDAREYRPHLTVSYNFSESLLSQLSGYNGPSWEVTTVALTRSAGGAYSTLALLPLTPDAPNDEHRTSRALS